VVKSDHLSGILSRRDRTRAFLFLPVVQRIALLQDLLSVLGLAIPVTLLDEAATSDSGIGFFRIYTHRQRSATPARTFSFSSKLGYFSVFWSIFATADIPRYPYPS
jgi:hypothetical protein